MLERHNQCCVLCRAGFCKNEQKTFFKPFLRESRGTQKRAERCFYSPHILYCKVTTLDDATCRV
jgi:hypothetical protein